MTDNAAFQRKMAELELMMKKKEAGEKLYAELGELENMCDLSSDDDLATEDSEKDPALLDQVDRIRGSEQFKESQDQQKVVSMKWARSELIGSTNIHHCITSQEDLQFLSATYNKLNQDSVPIINVALMTSGKFDILGAFKRAVNDLANSGCDEHGKCKAPKFDIVFAWLSYAAQCDPNRLAPPNELTGSDTSAYVDEYLNISDLPTVDVNRTHLAVSKIVRIFEVLSAINMDAYSASELAVLIFAISKLLIDENADLIMQAQAVPVFSNIFSLEDNTKILEVVEEFGQLFPLLSDDEPRALYIVMDTLRSSASPSYLSISLVCSYLVHLTGRSELSPDKLSDELSSDAIADMYIDLMCSLVENSLGATKGDVSQQWALVNLISSALNPELLRNASPESMITLSSLLESIKKRYVSTRRTDLCVVDFQVREILQRFNRLATPKTKTMDSSLDETSIETE